MNRVGASQWSDFLRVGLADQVAAPAILTADLSLSTATTATLKWSQVPSEAIDVEGYVLQMQTDADNWIDIFDASHNSNALSTTVFGLQTAKPYRFRVLAVDFNGRSEPSSEYQIYACGLPRFMSPPQYVDSSQNTITISWRAPKIDGGCPVYDYQVERDADGTGASWTEVNPISSYPRNDPYVFQFTCELFPLAATIGDPFVFRVIAFNTQGSLASDASAIMYLASVPDQPTNSPVSDAQVTSRNQIKVDYAPILSSGGLPLLSYQL